jgi:hypothetical protein
MSGASAPLCLFQPKEIEMKKKTLKTFNVPSNIGVGLFETEPVTVGFSFPDGTKATLRLRPLTQEVLVEAHKLGIKSGDFDNPQEAADNLEAMLGLLIDGGEWDGMEINAENRGRIASHAGLLTKVFEASRYLAEEVIEEEEGNSDS